MPSYTEAIAHQPNRLLARRAHARMPRSRVVDAILGVLSVPYAVLCLTLLLLCSLLLLPLLLLRLRRRTAANISTEQGGSLTALKTLNARAVAAACGFGPDRLAIDLIARASLMGEGFVGWLLTQYYWRSLVLGFRLTRRLYSEQIVPVVYRSRFKLGEVTYLQLRTCWLDDVVEQFVSSLEGAPGQLVILGAGYDTRCLRLSLPASIRRFEVDAPGTQAQKRAMLHALAIDDEGVTYVTCDFSTQRWLDALEAQGFSSALPTCVVWEGVSVYLAREVVESTLRDVSECAAGSVIGWDYVGAEWALTPTMRKLSQRGGEPWQFGLAKGEPVPFVEGQGLVVLDHLGHETLQARYLPRHANGETVGYCGDFGGFILAGPGGPG